MKERLWWDYMKHSCVCVTIGMCIDNMDKRVQNKYNVWLRAYPSFKITSVHMVMDT